LGENETEARQAKTLTADEARRIAINIGEQGFRHQLYSH
jgi:hypothetical protein